MVTIGVAVPCYGRHIPHLKRLFDSIEAQTRKPDMVIVSCSSATRSQIPYNPSDYSFKFDILVWEDRKNAAQNRNIAADHLMTDYITFFDADDVMHPQRIEMILSTFEKYPACGLIVHNFHKGNIPFEMYESSDRIVGKLQQSKEDWLFVQDSPHYTVHNSQATIPRSMFKSVRYREGKEYERREDSVFCGDVLRKCGKENVYITNPLSQYFMEGAWY